MAGLVAERLANVALDLCRREGAGLVNDTKRLSALLNDTAPDLQPQIRGLIAALSSQVPIHIRAAPNPAAATSLAAARLAAEHDLTPAQANDAIEAALQVTGGNVRPSPAMAPAPTPVPAATEWVGVSTAVTPPPLPQPAVTAQPAQLADTPGAAAAPSTLMQTVMRRKWIVGAVAVAAVAVAASLQPQQTEPQTGPAGPRELPVLSANTSGPLPTIQPVAAQGGTELDFAIPIPNGVLVGTIVLQSADWQTGIIGFAHQGSSKPESLSTTGPFALNKTQQASIRVMQPVWKQDSAHAGDICIAFFGPAGADVKLHGSRLCLLEAVNRNCSKIIGCGNVA